MNFSHKGRTLDFELNDIPPQKKCDLGHMVCPPKITSAK